MIINSAKKGWIVMDEKRKAQRLNDVNEITISVIPDDKNLPQKVFYNYSKNISESGVQIQANMLLPVNSLLKIDFSLDTLNQMITVFGKVKWMKSIIEEKCYEVGVEFVDTSSKAIKKIYNYISWKQKNTSVNPVGLPFWIFTKFNESEFK